MRTSERTRHLILLAHIWAISPFAFLWLWNPDVGQRLTPEHMEYMRWFTFGVLTYFVIRTVLAFKNPPWLRWEYVFPPLDVLLVTVMLAIGDRNPMGNVTVLYFLPI